MNWQWRRKHVRGGIDRTKCGSYKPARWTFQPGYQVAFTLVLILSGVWGDALFNKGFHLRIPGKVRHYEYGSEGRC